MKQRWRERDLRNFCVKTLRLPVTPAAPAPVILFDGVCNLCNLWVKFVIRHDPAGTFRFAVQQSSIGQAMIGDRVGINGAPLLSSVILIVGGSAYTESTAVLEICARLGQPWSWLAFLRIIPRELRDACYRFVVRHRYQWFGRTDTCQVPSSEMRWRFIG
jgi:predicted DCC family thiol-disulfide oxidoreductase YuxK